MKREQSRNPTAAIVGTHPTTRMIINAPHIGLTPILRVFSAPIRYGNRRIPPVR